MELFIEYIIVISFLLIIHILVDPKFFVDNLKRFYNSYTLKKHKRKYPEEYIQENMIYLILLKIVSYLGIAVIILLFINIDIFTDMIMPFIYRQKLKIHKRKYPEEFI